MLIMGYISIGSLFLLHINQLKLINKKGGLSMDWIVWEMLEKLKADKKILSRVRDEARVLCET